MRTQAAATETADRILDAAERLVQTQGFNGFSYADIAAELGITKASLHYHFTTKAELGQALIERYHRNFVAALEKIDRTVPDARDKLRRYVRLYTDVLRNDRMCLCGMLAADHATLPKPMREGVRSFFDANEAWLASVLTAGRRARHLRVDGPVEQTARLLLGALEGAMLIARSYGEVSRFEVTAERLIAELGGAAREPERRR